MIKKYWKNTIKYGIKSKIYLEKNYSEPVYNEKYIKAKINPYNKKFYGNKTTIESKHYTYFFCSIVRFYC